MDEQKRNEFQDEDLERYGVWVKAGPEEVVEAEDEFSFADLPAGTSAAFTDAGDVGEATGTDSPESDDFDFPDIEELDLDDEEQPSIPDIDLDDGLGELHIETGEATDQAFEDEDIVTLDDFDLEEPEEDTDPFAVLEDESDAEESTEDEPGEFDLDELTDSLEDDYEELAFETPEEPGDDDEGSFDSTMPGSDDELEDITLDDISIDDEQGEDLPELDSEIEHDFTPEDQGIEIVDTGATNRITPDEEEFLNSDEDLQNPDESAIQKPMDTQEREAFERIQTELHDIRRELAELKETLRAGAVHPPFVEKPEASTAETSTPEEDLEIALPDDLETDESRGSGFFEEDEDETIALTGDELDNILNTAEFTELAGEEEELDDDFIVETSSDDETSDDEISFDDETSDDEISFDDETAVEPSALDDDLSIPETTEDSSAQVVSEIETEPMEEEFENTEDDPAVNELAEMDIDQELSDIEGLSDETLDEQPAIDGEIEIDLDALDDIEEENFDDLDESSELDVREEEIVDETPEEPETVSEDDDFDSFASAVEQDIAGTTSEIDEIELSDDFDDEISEEESVEEPTDEEEEIELDLDDLDLEDIDLNDGDVVVPEVEPSLADDDTGADADEIGELEVDEFPQDEQDTIDEDDLELTNESDEEIASPIAGSSSIADLPDSLKQEIRSVLSYMDQLLEALPDDKIEEFAQSEHFDVYKRLFEELGLET